MISPVLTGLPVCLLAFIVLGGLAYLLLAIARTGRFRERRAIASEFTPPATLMVPVHGAPRRLYECLSSICKQDYPAYQVVFGLHSADDPGRKVIEQVMAELPEVDFELVVDGRRIGANPKVCNLANMYRAVKHDVIVAVDSDVLVDPHFLRTIVEPLADPAVGGVTCVYQGAPDANLPSVLGALHINDWFIPSALVDLNMGEMRLVYGASYALTRHSLLATGGFPARASAVAEDDVLGALLYKAGFKIRLAPYVVATVVAESNFRSLFRRELRWMCTIRACRPLEHLLSVVMYAQLPGILLTAINPAGWTFAMLAAVVALRWVLHGLVRRRVLNSAAISPWLVPLRDGMSFLVWAASFFTRSMRWGQHTLHYVGRREIATKRSDAGAEP